MKSIKYIFGSRSPQHSELYRNGPQGGVRTPSGGCVGVSLKVFVLGYNLSVIKADNFNDRSCVSYELLNCEKYA